MSLPPLGSRASRSEGRGGLGREIGPRTRAKPAVGKQRQLAGEQTATACFPTRWRPVEEVSGVTSLSTSLTGLAHETLLVFLSSGGREESFTASEAVGLPVLLRSEGRRKSFCS